MVKDTYKPDDSEYRVEEEAMLREMVEGDFLNSDEYVRFGAPNMSRIFLKDEVTSSSRPYSYPSDVEEKPELVRSLYSEYMSE